MMQDSYFIERIETITPEVLEATQKLVPELATPNQMAVTKENLQDVVNASCNVWLAARAHTAGEIVGMVVLAAYPTITNVRTQVENLVVAPEHRGRGVAEALLRRVIEEADKLSVNTVRLSTGPSNSLAQKLFEKLGFQPDPMVPYLYALTQGPRK